MADPDGLYAEICGVLLKLSVTSCVPARRMSGVIVSGAPGSMPPPGVDDSVPRLVADLEAAGRDEGALARVLARARAELAQVRRRRLPVVSGVGDADDLVERVLRDGERLPPRVVAVALRSSERIVRRVRVTHGRDAEMGKSQAGQSSKRATHVGSSLIDRRAALIARIG